jgi:hypothetical protein
MHYILLLHCNLNVMQSDKIKCMLEETYERCGDDIKKYIAIMQARRFVRQYPTIADILWLPDLIAARFE